MYPPLLNVPPPGPQGTKYVPWIKEMKWWTGQKPNILVLYQFSISICEFPSNTSPSYKSNFTEMFPEIFPLLPPPCSPLFDAIFLFNLFSFSLSFLISKLFTTWVSIYLSIYLYVYLSIYLSDKFSFSPLLLPLSNLLWRNRFTGTGLRVRVVRRSTWSLLCVIKLSPLGSPVLKPYLE